MDDQRNATVNVLAMESDIDNVPKEFNEKDRLKTSQNVSCSVLVYAYQLVQVYWEGSSQTALEILPLLHKTVFNSTDYHYYLPSL